MLVPAFLLAGMSVPAQQTEQKNKDAPHEFETLFIAKNGGLIGAYRSANITNRSRMYKHENATNTIEWALDKARITVVTKGSYLVSRRSKLYFSKDRPYRGKAGIEITRDDVSLIIAPGAELKGPGDSVWFVTIVVGMADNVNVFNLGTLNTGNTNSGSRGWGIEYQGHRGKEGESGCDGGIVFSTGQLLNMNAGCWMVDCVNMKIPLILSEHSEEMNGLVAMEGVYDSEIGTLGRLEGMTKSFEEGGQGEGEAIDMNMSCKRIHMEHVIGMAPSAGDEIVDFNNCEYITTDRITAFVGEKSKGALLVGYDLYGHSGIKSKRSKVPRQKGHIMKKTERIQKEVAGFRQEVSYPGFPESLPPFRANVRLVAEFEDGSEQELLNKKYEFDL